MVEAAIEQVENDVEVDIGIDLTCGLGSAEAGLTSGDPRPEDAIEQLYYRRHAEWGTNDD